MRWALELLHRVEQLGWFATVVVASVLLLAGGLLFRRARARRARRDARVFAVAQTEGVHLPASLHPVIDPDICIGSLSCIKACPEGDILGVVDGVAKLIIGANCIGHGRCVVECPVDAIKLVIGSSERGVDLPQVDTHFQSSRPGVHIVGELGGMGLIKNAVRQGLQAAAFLGRQLDAKRAAAGGDACDVAIVGAGPAGIATAVGLRAAGVSFRILEQGAFGGTIAHYPRHKVVMSERVEMPLVGSFGKPLVTKEELLDTFQRIAKKVKLTIEEGVKVEGIEGDDGAFEVLTNKGPVLAKKVVLAIGRRGSPRKLGVPGEDLDRVTYNLVDAEQYAGCKVVVVGGGDSALEAAMALAERGDVEVIVVHRTASFDRCRAANRQRAMAMIEQKKIVAFFSATVARIEKDTITILYDARKLRFANDYVIACLGGELPATFLENAGVEMIRHEGMDTIESPALAPRRTKDGAPQRTYLGVGLALIGATVLLGLAWVGSDYYVLGRSARARSPLHDFLRSSGPWGHGVGIVATLFMMSNFLYPLRKRWSALKGTAPIRSWLTFHIFVGIMSPLTIAFHAAFQSRNQLATATFVSLCVVVATGLVGRFIYGLVPSTGDTAIELSVVRGQLERAQARLGPVGEGAQADDPIARLIARIAVDPARRGALLAHLLAMPLAGLVARLRLWRARGAFADRESYLDFRETYLATRRLHTQVSFYGGLKRFLSGWRVFHVVLSIFLVVIIAVHIGLSVYLGYRWIF